MKGPWDNIKPTNIHIIGIPRGEVRMKGKENLFEEIMAKNFPNLVKETSIQVEELQSHKQDEPNNPTPKHIING